MEYSEPKSTLLLSIERLEKFLKHTKYSNKLNKSEIEIIQQSIRDLLDISDSIEFYEHHPLYILLHRQFHLLMQGKVPIYAFEIRINLRPGNHAPAKLQFDLFPKELPKRENFEFG